MAVVHGLETLKRLNDEASAASEKPKLHELKYVGGKFDGKIERRKELPKDGEHVYRIIGRMYAKYIWNGSVFVFESIET
jgi:hypothetical protein